MKSNAKNSPLPPLSPERDHGNFNQGRRLPTAIAVEEHHDFAPPDTRTTLAKTLAIALCLFAFAFLVSYSVKNDDPFDYIQSRQSITELQLSENLYQVTDIVGHDCEEHCYEKIISTAQFRPLTTEMSTTRAKSSSGRFRLIRLNLKQLQLHKNMKPDSVIVLPRLRYERAELYVGGRFSGTFLQNDRIHWVWQDPPDLAATKTQYLDALLTLPVKQNHDDLTQLTSEPTFASSWSEFKYYEQFMEAKRTYQGRQVETIARVVLAIFALLLFLMIDSSPEAMSLALFMGFEACAVALGQTGLRITWFPEGFNYRFPQHFLYSMGAVFRLYFFLQMARIIRPNVKPWLFWGVIYALPNAWISYLDATEKFWWYDHTWVWRVVLTSLVGIFTCSRVAINLHGKNLPWRTAALWTAVLAAATQLLYAPTAFFPEIRALPYFQGTIGVLSGCSMYLFALSTFFNISTLENRVASLSKEKVEANKVRRELELGRSLQQAFLKPHFIPPEIDIASFHEAAVFVSGDTYIIHWQEDTRVMTCLLNDVTGHGIQAGLKAFASNVIARSIWSPVKQDDRSGKRLIDRRRGQSKFVTYDRLVDELICQGDEIPDFNAMVGAEIAVDTGLATFYRVSYNFPIMFTPQPSVEGAAYHVEVLALGNRKETLQQLSPGAGIIFIGDGFIESSKQERALTLHLKDQLKECLKPVTAAEIRDLILAWAQKSERPQHDDQTLIVLIWQP